MYGQPRDVDGECNAHLYLADDYGDNAATIRCQLPRGHDGEHQEICRAGTVKIEWSEDARCWAFKKPTWEWNDEPYDGYFDSCAHCHRGADSHGDPQTRFLKLSSDETKSE